MEALRTIRVVILRVLVTAAMFSTPARAADAIRYNRDIRPVLSDNCFTCHGPDKNKRKSGLRLDIREEAVKPAKSGATAIVPGRPEKSELVRRIFTDDEDDLMPPPKAYKILSAEKKDLLKAWIAAGAKYEPHWAYAPVEKPPVPGKSWFGSKFANPVDAFVSQPLAAKGISPAPEADRRTLIRRVSLDLTGLPPTPAEVAAFVSDTDLKAYEKLVDRLLASPHYGERMAQHWLDLARYADTVGFHGDQNQNVWPYRDYVINAFNSDKPFDQFTIEQLAGDLLPNPTEEQLTATCFNRLNMMTREGGAQPKEYLTKYTADRVRTVATTWLGSTFTCAECHDHKYDPITQKDFYSLGAFFGDVKQWGVYSSYGYTPNPELEGWNNEHPFPPEIFVESPVLKKRIEAVRARMSEAVRSAAAPAGLYEPWLASAREFLAKNPSGWITPEPEVELKNGAPKGGKKKPAMKAPTNAPPQDFEIADDNSIVFGNQNALDTFIEVPLQPGWLAAMKIELLPAAKHKDSILRRGNQTEVKAGFQVIGANGKARRIGVRHAQADRAAPRYSQMTEIIGVHGGWKIPKTDLNKPATAVYFPDMPAQISTGEILRVELPECVLSAVRISVSPLAPSDLRLEKGLSPGEPGPEMFLRTTAWDTNAFAVIRKADADYLECRGGKNAVQVTQAWTNILTARVLPRGNWQDETGEICPPATPHFLPAQKVSGTTPLTRLDLARWLVARENPVTPRVVANRLWKQFFGTGLSQFVDDIGSQGEPPSHPELLDWLAVRLRDSGWDIKDMVRLIVTSKTYKQVSGLRPEVASFDPNNRLLAAQNPRRLEAEIVRDNALAISGLINLEIGGPSARPYQPAGYYVDIQFPDRDYAADKNEEQWRRGLYTWWQRTFLHPMMANFEAPSREDCIAMRTVANTPQQALTLLNDTTFVEAARVWASRLLETKTGDDAARIAAAYEQALARAPHPAETQSLLALLGKVRAEYGKTPEDAAKLVKTGIVPSAAGDATELAAWTTVCRVVLNLHETITRY